MVTLTLTDAQARKLGLIPAVKPKASAKPKARTSKPKASGRIAKAAALAERNPAWLPGSPKTLAWEAAHPDAVKLPPLVKPEAKSKREPMCPKGCKPFVDIKLATTWAAEGSTVKPAQVLKPVGTSGKTGAGLFCRHQLVA